MLEAVVAYARAGDQGALRYLCTRFGAMDEADLHDPAILEKLSAAVASYDRASAPFGSWLRTAAKNAAMAGDEPWDEPVGEPWDEAACDRDDGAWQLRTALRRLRPEERQVLVMRYYGGLSAGQVAERLGKSLPAVNALHHRARYALREALAEADGSTEERFDFEPHTRRS